MLLPWLAQAHSTAESLHRKPLFTPAPALTVALMFACRYPSDDINKFLWMVRIGGGVFPDIKEADYLGPRGYTIDDSAGKVSSRLRLLSGWDWDGEVWTSSLLQHGPGLKRVLRRGYR